MKTISLATFQSLNIELSDYNKKTIEEESSRANEINKFHPCKLLINVSGEEDKFYYEHCTLKLQHKTLDISIRFDGYRKKYSIFCNDIHRLKNITSHTVQEEKEKLTEPNQIGVLSAKKINDWINYYEQLYKNLEAINNGNDDKKKKFLDSLKGLKVDFYNDGNSGEIIKNGIVFKFKIEPTYISTNIEVHYECDSNLETFLKLSDNKYKK